MNMMSHKHDPLNPSKCQEHLQDFYQYLDGYIEPERRQEIQAHLSNCMPCEDALDFQAKLQRFISLKCQVEIPNEVRTRLLMALEHYESDER